MRPTYPTLAWAVILIIGMALLAGRIGADDDDDRSHDKQGDDHHTRERDHDHGGVGVGITIDLGKLTEGKKPEDPFDVPVEKNDHSTTDGGTGEHLHTQDAPLYKFGVLLTRDEDWWIPEDPGTTTLHARIYQWDAVKGWVYPATEGARIKFDLQSSCEPGDCMNGGDAEEENEDDLEIDDELNSSTLIVEGPDEAKTRDPVVDARILVDCHDWGAYGVMRASAEGCVGLQKLKNGKVQVAVKPLRKLRPNEKPNPPDGKFSEQELPRDINGNYIADQYEEDKGFNPDAGQGPAPKEDEDNSPVGDGTKGDGFTAYEEYRGFMVHRKHYRTDWKLKDLFIWDRDGLGLGDFPRASGLECWSILQSEMQGGDVDVAPADGPDGAPVKKGGLSRTTYPAQFRVINFNHDTAHIQTQTGLVLANEPNLYDGSGAKLFGESVGIGPPLYVLVVRVDASYHENEVSKSITNKELNGTTSFELPATITHELGHAVGIHHHGKQDSILVYVTNIRNDPNVPKDDKGQTLPVIYALGVKTIGEPGPNLTDDYPLPGIFNYCTKHGVYSGEAECYMRYTHPPNSIYRVRKGDDTDWESPSLDNALKMNEFCSSVQGTQFNSADHCGSEASYGNCLGQIVVNDTGHSRKKKDKPDETYSGVPPMPPVLDFGPDDD